MKKFILVPLIVFLAAACNSTSVNQQNPPPPPTVLNPPPPTSAAVLQISSPAFGDNQNIPQQYTCDGKSLSVPLSFKNVPAKTQSLALIMDDPDVPKTLVASGLFVHWVVFNMPASTTAIGVNQTPPGLQGNNGSGKPSYTGPCPPDRQHRYFFKLYALDTMLNLKAGATKDKVESAMNSHIIQQAQLIGLYDKKGNSK